MGKFVVVNEEYVKTYYEKRNEFNKLRIEVDEMSNVIKSSLLECKNPIGRSYGGYVAHLVPKNKLNDKFIDMLKNNGMQNKITEVCHIKDCKDIINNFTESDRDLYFEEWYKQLFVTKKK